MNHRKTYHFDVDVHMANAIRRALVADLPHVAPSDVIVHKNTTSHTDEYIVHRLGLVPFRCDDKTKLLPRASIVVVDRDVTGNDIFFGDRSVNVVDPNAPILRMAPGQSLDVEIELCIGTGADNARFARTVAVGMQEAKLGGFDISFETLIDDDHDECIVDAVDALSQRVQTCKSVIFETL